MQVIYPSTVIYLTKLYKKLLAILLFACGAVKRQQGSKVSVWLQVEAVEVGWLQAEAVTVKLESAASMAAVCPGGSTVPATVMIVVEYRLVYQLVDRS